ncbi:ATP-binding cassette domain-containing protein [Hydrogenophaga sp. 2FB]|uniref:ATP-binding cassette domain-containing protein n=1 Tax=Hydrogenophaga sp. 2FB TaxID=2502187 RepID=UPI0010F85A73|nr:ATP-binding cassette domain-containing protein [Hydrogenophaga sp. 2FB]
MLFELQGVSKYFAAPGGQRVAALRDISLGVGAGESVGLVGESGSGKTTLIRCALGLVPPDGGRIRYDDLDVAAATRQQLQRFRREVQLVFQDPFASLNPRMTVEELVGEGLLVHGLEPHAERRRERVAQTLRMVGLTPDAMGRHTHSFSGGQRQRIAIARALAMRPRLLVCDEPVSALDVSVQAQVINLLQEMQRELGLTILFVAHDLAVVRHLCTRIYVMHHGEMVESGDRESIFEHPRHAYTQALLAAVPVPDPQVARARRKLHRLNSLAQQGAGMEAQT